ncbi:MAG: exo-alpha-sialidase [Armatimonadetes bacterium]|nr:exo-alpha-sialidase [Armatimonadota bacterium]
MKVVSSEFVFLSAPFASCHASTVVETSAGTLMCAWFGGTAESNPDVAVWAARRGRGGWSKPEKVAVGVGKDGRPNACYNPVLFQPRRGPLLLFYKVGTGPQTWWGMMTRSADDGVTWQTPGRLPEGILGPIKNKPIELRDGTLLCGSSDESPRWSLHMETSKDLGLTWQRTPSLHGPEVGAIQPSLLQLGGSKLRAVGRTQQGKVFAIDSSDQGRTWGPIHLLDLPNPNAGTDAVRLRDGRFLLVYNNSATARTPLSVAVSTDAEHWSPVMDLESGPGEYSYPAVIQTRDGLVHVTYTWRRERIRHVVIDPSPGRRG